MSPATLVLLLSSTVVIAILVVRSKLKGRESRRIPPGEHGWSWSLFGDTASFAHPHPAFTLGDFMAHRVARFGKIFTAKLFGGQVVVSADAEMNRFVLQSEMKLFQHNWTPFFAKLAGESSLMLSVGDAYKHRRSVLLGYFSGARLETSFLADAERIAAMIMDSWKDKPVVHAEEESRRYAFYLITKKTLGLLPGEPEIERLMEDFEVFFKGLVSLPIDLPGTAFRKAMQARKNIVTAIRGRMEEKMRKKNDGCSDIEDDGFISWVMDNSSYSWEEIVDLVQGFLFAGHDTASRAIPMAIYFLEGCPKAVEQLREEHIQLVESKKVEGSKLTWSDYKTLEFTQCVINETLRLGNVATVLLKRAITDVQYKDYVIPSGSTVVTNLAAVHLDPSLFEDPEHFNPWRWLGSSGLKRSNNFMPFGGGPRHCLGIEFAKLEMTVFLHQLVLKYNWELMEPDPPTAFPYIKFVKGLPIKVRTLPL